MSYVQRALVIGGLAAALSLLAACGAGSSKGTSSLPAGASMTQQSPYSSGADTKPAESREPVEPPAQELTRSQEEAVQSAESYLSFSAFSLSGLVDQLEYEGFSKSDATIAVKSLNVDWNDQAAKSAASYLDSSAFSRSGLIDQLEYEGFSSSQAEYGADAAFSGAGGDSGGDTGGGTGGGDSVSRQNAVESASSYLNTSAFSRSGLIDQLEYEGFSNGDATYAVDSLNVDWNEQAAMSAQSYLDINAFSRSGLIEQLEYEGFTSSQAAYGVAQAGL